MAELSTINFINSLIPSADQLNNPQREGAADVAHVLQYLTAGATVPAEGMIFGGLSVSGKAADMRVDVAAGAGALYDGAVAAPQHPLKLALLREDDTSAALNDGDGSDPRIDVISVSPVSALLDTEPMLQIGGGTTDVEIRRGPSYTINVTEGVPDPSPVAPSTPSGAIKLAEVLVPAGLTAGGGGTVSATITDYRNRYGAEVKGPDTSLNGWVQNLDDWTIAGVVTLLQAYGVQDAAGKVLAYALDRVNHWPAIFRAGVPAGDNPASLYPLVNPGGREYWIRIPATKAAAIKQTGGAGVEDTDWQQSIDTELTLIHLTGIAANIEIEIPIPVDIRGLEILEFDFDYTIGPAFNSAGQLIAQVKRWDRSAGTKLALTPSATPDTTSTGTATGGAVLSPAVVTDDGDTFSLYGLVLFEAVNDGAVLTIHNVGIKVREGRQP